MPWRAHDLGGRSKADAALAAGLVQQQTQLGDSEVEPALPLAGFDLHLSGSEQGSDAETEPLTDHDDLLSNPASESNLDLDLRDAATFNPSLQLHYNASTAGHFGGVCRQFAYPLPTAFRSTAQLHFEGLLSDYSVTSQFRSDLIAVFHRPDFNFQEFVASTPLSSRTFNRGVDRSVDNPYVKCEVTLDADFGEGLKVTFYVRRSVVHINFVHVVLSLAYIDLLILLLKPFYIKLVFDAPVYGQTIIGQFAMAY